MKNCMKLKIFWFFESWSGDIATPLETTNSLETPPKIHWKRDLFVDPIFFFFGRFSKWGAQTPWLPTERNTLQQIPKTSLKQLRKSYDQVWNSPDTTLRVGEWMYSYFMFDRGLLSSYECYDELFLELSKYALRTCRKSIMVQKQGRQIFFLENVTQEFVFINMSYCSFGQRG